LTCSAPSEQSGNISIGLRFHDVEIFNTTREILFIGISVLSINPPSGIVSGGFYVTIKGKEFPFTKAAACILGNDFLHGTVLDSQSMICKTKPVAQSGNLVFGVFFGGQRFFPRQDVQFRFFNIIIENMYPSSIITKLPTVIQISGKFEHQISLCKFGSVISKAFLVSSSMISCLVEFDDPGTHLLQMSHDNVFYLRSSMNLVV